MLKRTGPISLLLVAVACGLLTLPARAQTKVRILVAYTGAAEAVLPSNLREYIEDYVIDLTNGIYAASASSGVTLPMLELAGITKVSYTESVSASPSPTVADPNDMQVDLDRMITVDGYMDELHTLRNLFAADVVMLVFQGHSGAVRCVFGNCTGPWDGIGANATYAFFVAKKNPYFAQYVVAHEIGHLFGCRHAKAPPAPNPGDPPPGVSDPANTPYAYGHGYFDTIPGPPIVMFGDVMGSHSYYRQAILSTPYVNYAPGYPMGNATYADCARVHHEQKSTVAAFRTPVSSAVLSSHVAYNQHYADVVGTNVSTSGTVTFQSGSEGKLRATGSVSINPGFSTNGSAKLTVSVGASALAKSAASESELPEKHPEEQRIPEAFFLRIQENRGGVALAYSLPEDASLSVRVRKITGELVRVKTLGLRNSGLHEEIVALDAPHAGIYVVSVSAGKKTVTRRVFFGSK
ncbi:MAG: hypothetical protein K0Q91_1125 [Fibrobacteria bacterium]|nr:hypothetical protein [Fibrobacteria bacterium]